MIVMSGTRAHLNNLEEVNAMLWYHSTGHLVCKLHTGGDGFIEDELENPIYVNYNRHFRSGVHSLAKPMESLLPFPSGL